MHGAWRVRGSHSPAHNATFVALLAKGLVEIVDIDDRAQVRITRAGITASQAKNLKDKPPPTDSM